jgi:signal transduction histidine kinase
MFRTCPGGAPGESPCSSTVWKVPVSSDRLSAFGRRLAERRADILANWAAKVDADPKLLTGASLPLAQLHDHLTALLEDFEARLGMVGKAARQSAEDVQAGDAAAHGLHRWQQGFDLAEVVRELGRLNETVVAEIDRCASEPLLEGHDLSSEVHRVWAGIYSVATSSSVEQFFKLQQIEAAGHVQDLEQALGSLQTLETQRASLWQQAAHDLRGNLSVVSMLAAGLATPVGMAGKRERFLASLDRNVRALHSLLEDVTSLARLQGGQEVRIVAPLDAAQLVRDLVAAMESLATERGLQLSVEGPHEFMVDGDAIKIRRIVSNLLLNALRYTIRGSVTLRWGRDPQREAPRWFVEVEDTGPGFQKGPSTALAGAISIASGQASDVAQAERDGEVIHVAQAQAPAVTAPAQGADRRSGGEGIGLSIVKRLCTLLDATIEIDSQPHRGTRFTILLPLRYEA